MYSTTYVDYCVILCETHDSMTTACDTYMTVIHCLHYRYGNSHVVRYLVTDAHCDPNVKDNEGWTPLHNACKWVPGIHDLYIHVHVSGGAHVCYQTDYTHVQYSRCNIIMILDNIQMYMYIYTVSVHIQNITLPLEQSWATICTFVSLNNYCCCIGDVSSVCENNMKHIKTCLVS